MARKEDDDEFVDGTTDSSLRVSGYGSTVRVVAKNGVLKLVITKPKRRTIPVGSDSGKKARRNAVTKGRAIAEAILERSGMRGVRVPRPQGSILPISPPLTVDDLWWIYLSDTWSGLSRSDVVSWGRRDVRKYYEKLTPAGRKAIPSEAYLLKTLQARARILASPQYPSEKPIEDLEPADWRQYATWRLSQEKPRGGTYKVSTVKTDFNVFRTVVRHCKLSRPKRWGTSADPISGGVNPVDHLEAPEISETQAGLILENLRAQRADDWRTWGVVELAHAFGRRIASIGPTSLQRSYVQVLCADDISYDEERSMEITFRSEPAKGAGFGRGDETLPAPRAVQECLEWIMRYHPNPQGSRYPLFWSPNDPRRVVSYAMVNKGLQTAWDASIEDPRPVGLAFHGFCRGTMTTVGHAAGVQAAAEWSGRSYERVFQYLRRRQETQTATKAALERVRSKKAVE